QGEKTPNAGGQRTRGNPEKEREAGGGGAQGEKMPKACRRRTRGDPDLETEREAKKRSLAAEEASPSAMFAAFERGDAPQSEAKSERVYDVVESVTEESSGSPIPLLHETYIPDELASHPGIHHAFELAEAKYNAEKDHRYALFTMARGPPHSCLFNERRLLPICETAKDAVLLVSGSVIRLSSSLGRVPLNKCCGLWFQQDEEKKTAIVLTSAHLVRKQDPSVMNQWTGKYHRDARVIVHLLDGTTARGSLLYLQEHYEIALYEVTMHKPVELPTFNDTVHSGQDVFRLGRDDESLDLKITHGRVEYKIPVRHERCHYLYFSSDESRHRLLHDDGGPIVDLEGKVVGLVNNHINETFVPSCILHKCLDFWRSFKCMPRLHLGMTFTSINLLDPVCIERMKRKHNIESGLIVQQVSKGSYAEKLGIRKGDVIEGFNGKYVSTTIELESMLVDICWDHFDQRNKLYAEKDVSVLIYNAAKLCRRTRNLTVVVSDFGEDIIEGTYAITIE
uniref:PDZ domain-containing protein n=4 Tax=Aegilops tauschii subsp. strangulata TaxID=200361 RepID=A0A453JFV5_AEGTS